MDVGGRAGFAEGARGRDAGVTKEKIKGTALFGSGDHTTCARHKCPITTHAVRH